MLYFLPLSCLHPFLPPLSSFSLKPGSRRGFIHPFPEEPRDWVSPTAWGVAPKASPTAEVMHGGLVAFARAPWTVRRVYPSELVRWMEDARILACVCWHPHSRCMIHVALIYGYPPSHPSRHLMPTLLRQLFLWCEGVKGPALVLGDFNMTRDSGEEMAGMEALGLTCLSPNRPTTWGKDMVTVAKGGAIDHIIGNMEARDLMVNSDIQQQATLSDHMSVCAKGHGTKCVTYSVPKYVLHVIWWCTGLQT